MARIQFLLESWAWGAVDDRGGRIGDYLVFGDGRNVETERKINLFLLPINPEMRNRPPVERRDWICGGREEMTCGSLKGS